jgi:pimeloyl-ACP methyl ester carboxylesterase
MFELAERFGDPTGIIAHFFGCPAVSLALRRCLHARSVVYIAPPDALDGGAQTFARVTGIGARGEAALKRRLTAMTGIDFDEQRVVNFGRGMVTPLLVVHDEEDKDVALRSARTYARHWPGCSVFTTAGLGHRQILRDPQVVQHVVSFVFGHRQSAGELDRWFDSALGDRSSFGAPRGAAPDGPPTPG